MALVEQRQMIEPHKAALIIHHNTQQHFKHSATLGMLHSRFKGHGKGFTIPPTGMSLILKGSSNVLLTSCRFFFFFSFNCILYKGKTNKQNLIRGKGLGWKPGKKKKENKRKTEEDPEGPATMSVAPKIMCMLLSCWLYYSWK